MIARAAVFLLNCIIVVFGIIVLVCGAMALFYLGKAILGFQ